MIERMYQFFCHLNHLNLACFGICINPKGCPPLTFHQTYMILGGCPPLTFHQQTPWKPLGWWKVRDGHPLKTCRLMKSEGWAPLWVDADSKKCQICVVQMTKNLVHSFYYILYQPKGVPIPRDNFSGSGGTAWLPKRPILGRNRNLKGSPCLLSIYSLSVPGFFVIWTTQIWHFLESASTQRGTYLLRTVPGNQEFIILRHSV